MGKRAAIYARFSCSRQREASIEDQLRVCHEWCAREGYDVVATYEDRAMSGRTDDRPEFQRMIDNAGESDVVLVYAMDRFSRDVYDAPIYKKRLRDKGVKVVSATESMPDGPESILLESIYEAMAAMESEHTSQRVRRGMEGNALKCMHNGVSLYGYDLGDDGYYHVNEGQAEFVREMFDRRLTGETVNSIARDMAARGVQTKMRNPCNYMMVNGILHNEKYVGVYSFNGHRVEGGMPAIVSRETFDMAQRVRNRKVRVEEQWSEFLLAGKGVCMCCGRNLVGTSGRGRHNRKYDYYRCGQKCDGVSVRREWLEEEVASAIRAMLRSRETALEIARDVVLAIADTDTEAEIIAAKKRLSEAQRGISNIMRAIESGMDFGDVSERLSQLKLQRARAESDIASLSRRVSIDPEEFADFLQRGSSLDSMALLDAFVWQVQLGPDRIVAVLNYDVNGEPARLTWERRFANSRVGGPSYKLCEPDRVVRIYLFQGCLVMEILQAA